MRETDQREAAVVRYRIVPERSRVWIEARSSLHPIHGEATGLEGELKLRYASGRLVTDPPPVLRLTLPVERLGSGNPLNDLQLRRVVHADRYPTISGEATSVEPYGDGYRVTGELTFHGVTRTVTDEVSVTPDGDGLVIEGAHEFDITDFGVSPPRILMLRVHPDVTVRIRAVAEPVTG
ncbi:MAG: YceI family protein [Micromonosporaceae bacterium]